MSVITHSISVYFMMFFLGAQNWVVCRRRHEPTIHNAKIAAAAPVAACRGASKLAGLAGLAAIFGANPNSNEGAIIAKIIRRCTESAAVMVRPWARKLERCFRLKLNRSKPKTAT